MSSQSPPHPGQQTFRLPRLAYLVVLMLLFGVAPLAFAGNGTAGSSAGLSLRTVLVVIPLGAALFIARTATVVDGGGIQVRAMFGRRQIPWANARGLTVSDRAVYVVVADGAVRLPCVRVSDLAALSRASGGHLPELAHAVVKGAPARRRHR